MLDDYQKEQPIIYRILKMPLSKTNALTHISLKQVTIPNHLNLSKPSSKRSSVQTII